MWLIGERRGRERAIKRELPVHGKAMKLRNIGYAMTNIRLQMSNFKCQMSKDKKTKKKEDWVVG